MIDFTEFTLNNGLKVLLHEDKTTETAVLNLLYKVGSRNETPDKTGFAHLFEHLMFGGSANIENFDDLLQMVGGESNAFTNPDITNYYITIPAVNIETAFWLESDRMLSLNFNQDVLNVQKKVVVEEFNQRYLNQPYGDAWFKLRALAYQMHPYQWPTIGKDISHIEDASLEDVKDFFQKFYSPNNAILVVAGNVNLETVKNLSEKYFGAIENSMLPINKIPVEPPQSHARKTETVADVPADVIFKAFHMGDRLSDSYYTSDLISDLLGRGNSSRLYDRLVKQNNVFTNISAFITGSVDPGLLLIQGKVNDDREIELADQHIEEVIEEFKTSSLQDSELQKVKNQAEASVVFSEVEVINRAMSLAQSAALGVPELVNEESENIQKVSKDDIIKTANKILIKENCSTLWYRAQSKK
jgi:zinc protease